MEPCANLNTTAVTNQQNQEMAAGLISSGSVFAERSIEWQHQMINFGDSTVRQLQNTNCVD